MSAPTVSDLQTLRFAHAGAPAVAIAPSNADTSTLAFAWAGAPVVAVQGGSAPVVALPVVFVVM